MLTKQSHNTRKYVDYLMAKSLSNPTSNTEVNFDLAETGEYTSISEEQDFSIPFAGVRPEGLLFPIIPRKAKAESPFDSLFDAEQRKRKKLIEEIKKLRFAYAQRLHKRIKLLAEEAEEEYPYEELLSVTSLEGFLKFIRQNSFKYPDATISPNGHIRIQWQQDKDHHLAIEFISDTEAKIVVFAPDPVHPHKVARASIRSSIDGVINVIDPFALDWTTE